LAVAKEANAIQRESIVAMQRFITSLELFIERGSVGGIHGQQPRIVDAFEEYKRQDLQRSLNDHSMSDAQRQP
jgi:hypothetical protein